MTDQSPAFDALMAKADAEPDAVWHALTDAREEAAQIVADVGSQNLFIQYDIYHMQIMEGGVPGRHEIDAGQEIHYPRVCKTILDTGFQGYFAHEFIPERDALTSLREAVKLCSL